MTESANLQQNYALEQNEILNFKYCYFNVRFFCQQKLSLFVIVLNFNKKKFYSFYSLDNYQC